MPILDLTTKLRIQHRQRKNWAIDNSTHKTQELNLQKRKKKIKKNEIKLYSLTLKRSCKVLVIQQVENLETEISWQSLHFRVLQFVWFMQAPSYRFCWTYNFNSLVRWNVSCVHDFREYLIIGTRCKSTLGWGWEYESLHGPWIEPVSWERKVPFNVFATCLKFLPRKLRILLGEKFKYFYFYFWQWV